MSDDKNNKIDGLKAGEMQTQETDRRKKHFRDRSVAARAGIILACAAGGILVLTVLFLCGATLFLTPKRLTELINNEANRTLNADVRVENARFTIWSTFPHFCVQTDSIFIVSRSLRGLSAAQRGLLPENCDSLAAASSMKGGINILKLMSGKIYLKDVEVNDLRVNIAALNDSVNNYSIFPQTDDDNEIPYFTANKIKINNPRDISYFSAANQSKIRLRLDDATLTRDKNQRDDYDLLLKGAISVSVKDLSVLDKFPFTLEGLTRLRFNPFNVGLHNYEVSLGNTRGKLNMDLDLGKEMSINDFNYKVNAFNLMGLLKYFPGGLPYLSRVRADVTLDANARLINAYKFSASYLPSVEVNFNIPDGFIDYTVNNSEKYSIRHEHMRATLFFDGENPDSSYLAVPGFSLEGEGMKFDIDGKITDLTGGTPFVRAKVRCKSDLGVTGKMIKEFGYLNLKGILDADANLNFVVTDPDEMNLSDISIDGRARLDNFRFSDSAATCSAKGDKLILSFKSDIKSLNADAISNADFSFNIGGNNFTTAFAGYRVGSPEISLSGDLIDNITVNLNAPAGNIMALPLNVGLEARSLSLSDKDDSLNLVAEDLSLTGKVNATPGKEMSDRMLLNVEGKNLRSLYKGNTINLSNPSLSFTARKNTTGDIPSASFSDSLRKSRLRWSVDSARLSKVEHTAEYMTSGLPERFKDIINRWDVNVGLKIPEGKLMSKGFNAPVVLKDMDINADFDSISLHNMRLRSGASAFSADGKVTGLRKFLTSTQPVPVDVNLRVAIDTLSINQLAKVYMSGKKKNELSSGPAAVDTTACILPRNLRLDLLATADMTRYMNLRLYDLSTRVRLRDGDAHIDSLRISADFGHAFLNASYLTSDIDKMAVTADLGIEDVNVVGFFKNFHTLLLMMPQMKNLSGYLSAQCRGRLDIYPSMYADVPSLFADIWVRGRDLNVRQNSFIRHITKMMLLPDSRDISFKNMNVHASVHDNLLELYPFNFEFEEYKLSMEGLNNFNGKLYYHIGVDKSPVPFPFGINIVNYFHDPKLKFGGPTFKIGQGEEITGNVMESNNFNVVTEVKRYIKEFIEKAAESADQYN